MKKYVFFFLIVLLTVTFFVVTQTPQTYCAEDCVGFSEVSIESEMKVSSDGSCPSTYTLSERNTCVKCPQGYFYTKSPLKRCIKCPDGYRYLKDKNFNPCCK